MVVSAVGHCQRNLQGIQDEDFLIDANNPNCLGGTESTFACFSRTPVKFVGVRMKVPTVMEPDP